MSQILGVKFNDYSQVYYFSSGPFVVREGQHVIVKTDQGMGLGKVVMIRQAPLEGEETEDHKPIYRLANDEDMEAVAENDALSRDAHKFCRECIIKHELGMKLVDVEVFFDRSKMIFYFTAPGRIDFRELIKDLVKEYRTRIELRQIGVRHETQMLGAIGNCGQLCCCRRFMRKFVPVTIKMAKEQNLFLNPTKISGICGRLLCCLSFEQDSYEEFHRECPKIGKKYTTSYGRAKVLRSNFFKKTLSLFFEGGEEREISLDEWKDIVNKAPGEGLEELSGAEPPSPRPRREQPRRDRSQGGSSSRPDRKAASCPEDNEGEAPRAESAESGVDSGEDKSPRKGGTEGRGARSSRKPSSRKPQQKRSKPAEDQGKDEEKSKRPRRRRRRRPPKAK
ncbi:PSP1 domain-containing protein [Salidesulfovibrio onnuriiensis]|uniref:PSP1 domain-containing protein n=1 Tax=Salidesulfovibrio onnuriiensis TaxID=2583823 RepID=UPI0011C874A0|nr:regulatory iron-sulfur-containing complex subunit RicT [Salidesulfovibrio onnuriiensis]